MSYNEIRALVKKYEAFGKTLPLAGTNSDGENVVVEGNDACYITTTIQKNNWCRINEYYPDGTVTELYER